MNKRSKGTKFELNFSALKRIGVLAVIVILTFSLLRNVAIILRADSRIESARRRLAELERKNQELKRQLTEAEKPGLVERLAREKLGLVKEGETVVVLPEEETLKKLAPRLEEERSALPEANWEKWLKLFL